MRTYTTQQIRNVALAGHSGSGKTTLTEAFLLYFNWIDRMGSVEAGTTQSDYDPEEHARRISINATVCPMEMENVKINVIDTPGSRDFVGDTKNALRVAEMALIVVDAVAGTEVGTEFAWEYAKDYEIPRAAFINKMDKDRANFRHAIETIRDSFGVRCIPITLPIGEGASFTGVIDLLDMIAIYHENGKTRKAPIPENMKAEAEQARRELVEAAAEGDDELTEKFLLEGTLSAEDVRKGLREDMQDGRFCPILCGSAAKVTGITGLLHFITDECPSPDMRMGFHVETADGGEALARLDPEGHASAFVFKTINDDYAGRLSLFKVISGTMHGDGQVLNLNSGKTERTGHTYTLRGRHQKQCAPIVTGDIGAFAKLESTHTGDTLCDPKHPAVRYAKTHLPQPTAHMRIHVKNRGDEDKISLTLHRLLESDPTLRVERDSALRQTILSGMGDTHLSVAASRLRTLSRVDLELLPPRVPYRETVTKTAEGQGKHKRQTGGHGQYGDCIMRFEPLERGAGYQFEWAIVGGVIPTSFRSSVDKGTQEALRAGPLAGYPVVDIKATCIHGSYHEVDSSDMAFQIAAGLAVKNVLPQCAPVILEPYLKVRVTAPTDYMGDLLGYLSQHRGRVAGQEQDGRFVTIEAEVPQAELATFSRDLRAMTHGRGVYETFFAHYEPCPPPIQAKVIEEAKRFAAENPE
jgi:elongation factor G